ncbi:O-acyltransferase like protein [Bacillus rossius redtenbacheri]|uniref:O-acyltransferase like protein n=1 Tax=Bacillus rossius redtenbacheri TaxID=93214 RepID=UPI002FDDF102
MAPRPAGLLLLLLLPLLLETAAQPEDMASMLQLYSPSRLAALLPALNLSRPCAAHYGVFLDRLGDQTAWALKMDDATGRYSSGLFFGNTYWLGSASQCWSIGEHNSSGDDLPPFPLGFYKLRFEVSLASNISLRGRTMYAGLCLPLSCTAADARQLFRSSAHLAGSLVTAHVTGVRSPHHAYQPWHDSTFWILVGVTVFMAAMIAAGTGYDLYLERKASHLFADNITFEAPRQKQRSMKKPQIMDPSTNCTSTNNNISNGKALNSISIYGCNVYVEPANVETTRKAQEMSIISEAMLSFSVRRNLKIICDKNVGEDTIPTIHGLRTISMGWVILGHTCIVAFKYSDNMEYRGLAEKELLFQTISNGAFSVDTFFFISGLLVSFLYFRTIAKIDVTKLTKSTGAVSSVLQFLGLLGYRFLRLTVPYMFVLGVVEVCMKWFYYNSVFDPPTMDHINCPKYWWRNALYINTLFPNEEMCMLWSWYLANDTQFFIIGIFILILAASHFRLAALTLVTFLLSSWCTTGLIAYSNKHIPSTDDPLALFDIIYDKPWTRLGPYLIGMATGWLLFKTNCTIRMNKVVTTAGWLLSTALFLLLVYGLYGAHINPITGAAYSSLSHSAWALGLAWIVVACSTGYGGYVNKLLSLKILYPFSRVTYCAYLVHPMVIRVMAMTSDSPLHLSKEVVFIIFLGQTAASYIFSFVVSLMFEAPVVSLLKLISPKRRKTVNATTTSHPR